MLTAYLRAEACCPNLQFPNNPFHAKLHATFDVQVNALRSVAKDDWRWNSALCRPPLLLLLLLASISYKGSAVSVNGALHLKSLRSIVHGKVGNPERACFGFRD